MLRFKPGDKVKIVADLSFYGCDDKRSYFSQGEIVKISEYSPGAEDYEVVKLDSGEVCYLDDCDLDYFVSSTKKSEFFEVGDLLLTEENKIVRIVEVDKTDLTYTYRIRKDDDFSCWDWIRNTAIKRRLDILTVKFALDGKEYDYVINIDSEDFERLKKLLAHPFEGTIEGSIREEYETKNFCPVRLSHTTTFEHFSKLKTITKINFKNIKEKDSMKNMFGNFYFGPYTKDDIKMSIKGLAYRNNENDFVVLDEDGSLTNVNDMVFDFDVDKMLYVMPVALKDVKSGDIIFHQKNPMFVTLVSDGDLTVVDPSCGELKVIIPEKNIFNFNFVSKLVDFSKGLFNGVTEDQPFGNILPIMMLSNSDSSSMKDWIIPLWFMQQNGDKGIFDDSNSLILAALMSGKESFKDMLLPMMFMKNGGFNFNLATE